MTIQFVDLRLSNQAASDATPAVIPLAATPLVFGDIGIQTAGVSAENQGNVRVLLTGFLKVENNPLFNTNTVNVRRNGTIIFTTTFGVAISRENEAFGFTAVDIPPPAAVATGQIQYTAEIFTNAAATDPFNNVQARNFSGVAAAGNS
ncbi:MULTISPECIES: hypothetical protein [Paenibacillus]|jgi:hypothetical protein|uniref:Exosporium protein C n=1 Tax=Paenibacillus odorifer TaxID=189426 RepID=A0A1R0YSA6_9BACL|nr:MULTISPECIES: hypothetical protein [Paenibacillus]AIQ72483.1 hypothetical protein PODO_03905 [Paenibacillus odorifer]AWV31848.1 hypothetical protein CD191_03950 [Paenibacillus odorifer]ETT53993.1 hypothetical protein C171_21099 [Paenibacillus sp. FSL H8-237]MDH6431411.1 hypothetical protein [Paenibacillus sp. PastH-4]MDH6447495.1 hypothetical protein [Paenibacillus sp. PastF-4]